MFKFKKNQKGFTLIELLIVIAVLGILAAVAIPAISGFVTTGKVGAANAELASVQTASQAYLADSPTASYPTTTGQGLASSALSPYLSALVKLAGGYTVSTTGVVSPTTITGTAVTYDGTSIHWDAANLKFIK